MSKYDIPYAMKPKTGKGKGTGKGKKSRYSNYIDEQENFMNRMVATPGRKLIAYLIFFSIFAVVFLTALRSSKHPDVIDYEIDTDLVYSNSRENNFIDDAIDTQNEADKDKENGIDIDEMDADDGEVTIEVPRKSIKKAAAGSSDKKAQFKGSKEDFGKELDDLISSGNEKLQKGAKGAKGAKANAKAKANVRIEKKDSVEDQVDDDNLIAEMEALEAKKGSSSHGRGKNAVKGQKIN